MVRDMVGLLHSKVLLLAYVHLVVYQDLLVFSCRTASWALVPSQRQDFAFATAELWLTWFLSAGFSSLMQCF